MKRTTITVPDEVFEALKREARRRSSTVSEVARQAILAHLGLQPVRPRHIPFAALGSSGHRHTARDIEEILAREWTGARDR